MDTIKLPDGPGTRHIGIKISCVNFSIGKAPSREGLLLMIQEQFKLPFTIKLPCGESITCETLEDVPLEDTPCPCGDPNHWLVRWSE